MDEKLNAATATRAILIKTEQNTNRLGEVFNRLREKEKELMNIHFQKELDEMKNEAGNKCRIEPTPGKELERESFTSVEMRYLREQEELLDKMDSLLSTLDQL